MKVLTDENSYVTSYALVGELVDGTELPEPEDTAHFEEHFSAYRIRDGDLIFDEEQAQTLSAQLAAEELRQQREAECFSVINRGQLWYDTLTESQTRELQTWYQAWLDVTETGQVPKRPDWL